MPPARKDSVDGDDLTRPSTSRAFSPSLAPPVKKSRSSLGAVPPSSSISRRQSMGRQARMEEFIDEKELQERLLMAATETADEMMKEEEEEGKGKLEMDSQVISAAAQIVWKAVAEDWSTDLVAFSRHAGRETIREDDVKLMMRRNPDLLAEVLAECEGEEDGEGTHTTGAIKRRSTGGLLNSRPRKEPREEEETEIFDDMITPVGAASSMDSVVPETPQPKGIVPLAHSTPMVGRSVSMMMMGRRGSTTSSAFSVPSPIREDEEKGGKKRVNRSIMNDLSNAIREEEEERLGGVDTQEMDEDFHPLVIDVRHPREQEEEERRMRKREDEDRELKEIMVARSQAYQAEPDMFENSDAGEEKKEVDYDSFDDDVVFENNENGNGEGEAEISNRMSESAALREMLDEEEEEKNRTLIEEEDSFHIQIVAEKKEDSKDGSPHPRGPSTSAVAPPLLQSVKAVVPPVPSDHSTAAAVAIRAVPVVSATSRMSSQDSFFLDDILDDPPRPSNVSAAAATVQQPSRALKNPLYLEEMLEDPPQPSNIPVSVAAPALQPIRADDYDSFDDDDDDDFLAAPSRSKENTPKAIGGPSPKNTVPNRGSTVVVEEVISPVVQKSNGTNRGVFAEDIFGLNDLSGPSKPKPINKTSPSVCTKPSAAANGHQIRSPTVSTVPSPTERPIAATPHNTVKKTPLNRDKKTPSAGFSSFTFSDSPAATTPAVKREDSDFMDTSTRQTTAMKTPKWRGGTRGRGFPRRSDPNSKVNRMIREQSTPVRLSPRPPSRINEIVRSFEDDDFDISAFDD